LDGDAITQRNLCSLLDSDSFRKCFNFFSLLKSHGEVSGWEMNIGVDSDILKMCFSAARIDADYALLAASAESARAEALLTHYTAKAGPGERSHHNETIAAGHHVPRMPENH
jgi:hypothetical protein